MAVFDYSRGDAATVFTAGASEYRRWRGVKTNIRTYSSGLGVGVTRRVSEAMRTRGLSSRWLGYGAPLRRPDEPP
jgi:hypothetical protein